MLMTTAWMGDSQAGSCPAWCSSRMREKALQRAEHRAMQHDGRALGAVLIDVIGAQALGHVQVDLQGPALPVAADGIAQHELELGPIESPLPLVQGVLDPGGRGGRP